MQTGNFNWRGSEGSITDRVTEDVQDSEDLDIRWSAYTRPSTGLVYMQNRYYEPETGRFTQADPMPYGLETILSGQNSRWTYCANDPVNFSDPTGLAFGWLWTVLGVLCLILGIALQILFNVGRGLMAFGASCFLRAGIMRGSTGSFPTPPPPPAITNPLDALLFDFVTGSTGPMI